MPDMTPVANQIIPPDPSKGINTFSGILGIKQQQQALQIGAAELSTAQSGATVAAQNAKEKMALAGLLQDPIKAGILDENGTPTPQAQSIIMGAAPTTGAEHAGKIMEVAKAKVDYNTSVNNLNANERSELSSAMLPVLSDPGSHKEDLYKALDSVIAAKAGTPAAADYQRIAATQKKFLDDVSGKASATPSQQEPWRTVGTHLALGLDPRAAVPQFGTAASGQIVSRPNALSTQTSVAPGFNPSSPQVAGQTAAATGASTVDNQVFGQVMSAGANADRGQDLAKRVEADAAQARTGKYSQEFADRLTVFQQHNPGATAIQMLRKDAANLKSLLESSAGSDKEREQIGSGMPSPENMNPDAIEKAARYFNGYFQMNKARAANAVAHVSKNGTQGLTLQDNEFMKNANPSQFAPPEPGAFKDQAKAEAIRAQYKSGKLTREQAKAALATLQ